MNATMTDFFGEMISSYSREQAIDDGSLVDLTEWASAGPGGMLGGYKIPVAVTRAVWNAIEAIPKSGYGSWGDVRGRAHDVLWMSTLAARGIRGEGQRNYQLILPVKGSRKRNIILTVHIGPGDNGEPVATIGFPSDF